jgi:predicted negative regulator of RcsB-dependent stress response
MNDLFERFPEMKPVKSAPTLQMVNGIGTTAYGSRDHDPETGTYVKTVWVTVVFLPIMPLASYRVADAPNGGWYFLGRVPVAGAAKLWTLSLVLLIGGVIGYFSWEHHRKSPSYLAGQKLERADQLRQEGKLAEAARLQREVAEGNPERAAEAMQALTAMLDDPAVQKQGDLAELAGAYRVAWELRQRPGAVQNLFQRGAKVAEARLDDNPAGSLAVLEAVEPAAARAEDYLPIKQKILERLTRDQPGNADWVSRLAVVYEQTGQRERCQPLLEPLANQLGTSEGARILGLRYFELGKHEDAYKLLQPYAEVRLKALRDAEQKYQSAFTNAEAGVIAGLRNGNAAGFNFAGWKTAPKNVQEQMVEDYLTRQMKDNPELNRLREALQREAVVVPVALDLGMMQMGRAQGMANPAERKGELERAEKTFLAVRGLVGGQAQYRLTLGQVYFWLGKQADGRKLFDEVLKEDGRKIETLDHIGTVLRELGATVDARKYFEEAYNKQGAEPAKRQEVAVKRALTGDDNDDRIVWLERGNPASPQVKSMLAEARGEKALREGRDEEAATLFRQAANIYAAQPESATVLNNGGLANLALYNASGDRAALEKGTEMMEKAITLLPSDGILMGNVAHLVLVTGVAEVIGDRIDLGKLRRLAHLSDLGFLYQDTAGRLALLNQVKENARVKRARTLFDRALILAPNNAGLYTQYQELLTFLDDQEGLKKLERRAAESTPELGPARQQLQEFWQGKNDQRIRREGEAAVARADRLLAAARPAGKATFALAASNLLQARLGQRTLGTDFDMDAALALAEEAHQAAPSSGTGGVVKALLAARASKALAAQDPEYAAMVRKAQRSLSDQYLIAVALWREGKQRTAALANPDVKRSIGMVLEDYTRFPKEPGEWSWIMLRDTHADVAARMAEALKTNERLRLERGLEAKVSPLNAVSALRRCWALEAEGKKAEIATVFRQCAQEGVPMPFETP